MSVEWGNVANRLAVSDLNFSLLRHDGGGYVSTQPVWLLSKRYDRSRARYYRAGWSSAAYTIAFRHMHLMVSGLGPIRKTHRSQLLSSSPTLSSQSCDTAKDLADGSSEDGPMKPIEL